MKSIPIIIANIKPDSDKLRLELSEYYEYEKAILNSAINKYQITRSSARVNWNGIILNNTVLDCVGDGHTGFISLWIYNINSDQFDAITKLVATDNYTCLQLLLRERQYTSKRCMQVIVKTDCKSIEEEELYYQYLAKYYKKIINDCSGELAGDVRVYLNQISKLRKYSGINFNNDSEIVSKENIPEINQGNIQNEHKEPAINKSNGNTISSSNGKTINDSKSSSNQLNISPEIIKFFDAVRLLAQQNDVYIEHVVDKKENGYQKINFSIYIKGNSNNANKLDQKLSEIQSNKQNIYFENNDSNSLGTICPDQKNKPKLVKGYREIIPIEEINRYLVDLLSKAEQEQGKIVKQLMVQFNRKDRTIRDFIAQILFRKSIHQTSSGNSVVVAKREKRPKHFLYLKSVD